MTRGRLKILMNLDLRWVPEVTGPRSRQSQLPKDTVRSGGLVPLTQPAGTVHTYVGRKDRKSKRLTGRVR